MQNYDLICMQICKLSIWVDINNGCKVNVDYKPPEDGLVRAETYVVG